jgi:putative ABC transport system permease protein
VTLLTVALNNLRRRKGRAAFLVAGLLIGVGTVVALISITQSMTGQTKANLQSFGANIVVTPRAKDVSLSYGGISAGGVSVGQQSLSQADAARIETIASRADISVVAPQLVGAVSVKGRRALLLGVRPEQQFKLKRWWSVGSGHAPTNGHELIAGAVAAKTLGLTMGDYVRIGGRRFTVTGVLSETGSQDDSLLVVDLGAAQQVLREPGKLTLIEIAALYAGAPVDRIAGEIGAALPQAKVTAMQEAVKSRQHAVDQFRRFSYAIVGVVIAIEALVVFITVMGSVSERTREIGVFRAIGFRQVHITRLILIEALIASTVAGVLGYAAGMAVTYIVLPLVAHSAEVAWAPLLGLAAVVLAVAIGGLASLYPALHAGKMDPTEALRAL